MHPFQKRVGEKTAGGRVVGHAAAQQNRIVASALVFQDWREDGLLTDFDRVHVLGMTEDYQRATVCMYLDGTLVAMGTVPQWIF